MRSLLTGDANTISYSCIKDTYVSDGGYGIEQEIYDLNGFGGNIDRHPVFVKGSPDFYVDLDYHLQLDSPCIDTGDPNTVGISSIDIDGDFRVMGGRIDIGADETYPTIEVISPMADEQWAAGSVRNIEWGGSNAYENVDIWFWFTDIYGGHWDIIEDDIANTGSYEWDVPEVDSDDCYLWVVTAEPDTNAVIEGSGWFSIKPYTAGPDVDSLWRTLGGDFDRKGLSEYWGPELGCVKWQFETEGPVSAGVTVGYDGRVYIPCKDGKIYTVDSDGALLWSYNVNSPILTSPSIGSDGGVYVGAMNGMLYAINIDGNLRWTTDTDSLIYSSPAVSEDGKVYVGSDDGKIYGFGTDGSKLWEFQTGGFGSMIEGAIFASPVVDANGIVYVGSVYDSNLYAFDGNDGSVKWVHHFDSNGWVFASPVLNEKDGIIY
ncbi:MAG: outer membrane protein assembly factor BamB family protein, partial [Planctomycetota bacterium]